MSNESKMKKLRALLALAGDKANEAEAMAALAMAQKYAAEYGLSLDDVKQDDGTDFGKSEPMFSGFRDSGDAFSMCDKVLSFAIAKFCCIKVQATISADGKENEIVYFGHNIDVAIAQALRKTINKAMNLEWIVYRDFLARDLHSAKATADAKISFQAAMANRIRDRMLALREEAAGAAGGGDTGTALVVAKAALLSTRAKEANFQEAQGTYGRSGNNYAAHAAGRDAGNRVKLRTEVGGGSKVFAIGRN